MDNRKKNLRLFKKYTIALFNKLKKELQLNVSPVIPIYYNKNLVGYLRAVTKSTLSDKKEIKMLALWRQKSEDWFPAQFKVTFEGTKKWVEEQLLNKEDRFLFMIETPTGLPIGHAGLYRFNFDEKTCEVDNVIRGEKYIPGIMTHALNVLIKWTKDTLGVKKILLEVFSDNQKAINLYERIGFQEFKRVPLKRVVEKDRISWVEEEKYTGKVKRYNVYMILRSKK